MFTEQKWIRKHHDGSVDEVVQTDEDYFECSLITKANGRELVAEGTNRDWVESQIRNAWANRAHECTAACGQQEHVIIEAEIPLE